MSRVLPLSTWAGISLDAGGFVAIAELETIEERTALTGTAAYLDVFVLCPGLHRQQRAPDINCSELPPCAALTTGYMFRVENPGTVHYFQRIGKTVHTVLVEVSRSPLYAIRGRHTFSLHAAVLLTIVALVFTILTGDWWALAILLNLMLARLCNIVIVRRRNSEGWKGVKEPDVNGQLLVLLSQDRWIRVKGAVDDLKAVTSGQWMRDMTFVESSIVAAATLLVYLDAALASNAEQTGKINLIGLLLVSAGLLGISNDRFESFQMFRRSVRVVGKPKAYKRRLDLAHELMKEFGTTDWAIGLGMIKSNAGSQQDNAIEVVL
ncbi:hypothetical protein MMC13_004618 [Lambiella insularis]|nr:hypothetical protein [Lambiella insularis]